MAVDANALTLPQYAMMSNDPLVQRVAFSLLEEDGVLNDIPLMTDNTLKVKGVRFAGDTLPSPTWANINEEPTTVTATPKDFEEQAFMIRNQIDTDSRLVNDRNQIVDPRGVRLDAYLRGVRYDFSDKFINNNHVSGNAKSVVGIRWRLDNPTVSGCESEMKINGGGVDLTQAAMTAGTANNFLELVDELLVKLGSKDGAGVVIYVNEVLERRWARAIRTLGAGAGFEMTTDAFDRPVSRYKGAVIRCIGRKADQSTQIIANTEASTGADGASTYTSLYGVRYGENAMTGWQFETLDNAVKDLGLLDNGVTYRTVIDWAVGLYQVHTRAVGRVYGIKMS
jgi:hypothetical protein